VRGRLGGPLPPQGHIRPASCVAGDNVISEGNPRGSARQGGMNRPITARTDVQTARAYWTLGRGDAERAFRAARRHSQLVRILRIALPVVVALAALAIFLMTYFNPLRMLTKLPVDVGDLVVSGTKITMQAPHLAGFTRDARAYELSADNAAQDLTKPDIVDLHNIRAKVQMQDKSTLEMTAARGIYNSKGEVLKLDHDIEITSTTGYAGHLSEATVDIRKGHVVSDKPVSVKLLQGTLDANRLEIIDSGDRVVFGNGVSMTLKLQQPDQSGHIDAQGGNGAVPQAKAGAR
jgi:lipopolysaccharide export system protein LptC